MSLSAIMLAHNKVGFTRAALESLLPTRGVELEVIVVDNGSTDATPELPAELQPRFRERGARLQWLRNESNVGCSTARNQGLEAAGGHYCAFLDNDVMALDGAWAQRLIATLEQEPHAAIVGPKFIYPFPPHDIQCAGVGISRSGRVKFRGRGLPRETVEFNRRREVQCLISACFLFRRALYREIGGLDEAFNPIEFEDFDLCYRARQAGGRCIYQPGVEFHHWESITSDGTPQLPNTYLIVKHGLLFKERWRHAFSREDGPPDCECVWTPITMPGPEGERTR